MLTHSECFLTVRAIHTECAAPPGGEPLLSCLPALERRLDAPFLQDVEEGTAP